jgi:hypothetical protein
MVMPGFGRIRHSGNDFLMSGNEKRSPGNDFLTSGNEKRSPGNDFLTSGNEKRSSGNDFLTSGNEKRSPGNDFLTSGNEKRSLLFHFPSAPIRGQGCGGGRLTGGFERRRSLNYRPDGICRRRLDGGGFGLIFSELPTPWRHCGLKPALQSPCTRLKSRFQVLWRYEILPAHSKGEVCSAHPSLAFTS